MRSAIRVTVWNEFVHERERDDVRAVYPQGIHHEIAQGLHDRLGTACSVRTATLEQPEHGLTSSVLNETDVLLWWGHAAHQRVEEAVVERVCQRVHQGMGLLVLHSGHDSKVFRRLMGTSCQLRWREAAETERVWIVDPGHPLAAGLPGEYFEIPRAEMYGEFFDIPPPEELVFISWFEGGEVFRSGCTFRRGKGKIFYFRPGHETYPIYRDANVRQVLANGVQWAAPSGAAYVGHSRHVPEPLHPIAPRK
jgi:trehalose utilization protein